MSRIKVNQPEIAALRQRLTTVRSAGDNAVSNVNRVRANLDWQVTSQQGIDDRLNAVQRRLQTQMEKMGQYTNFLNTVSDSFEAADRRIRDQAKGVMYCAKQVATPNIMVTPPRGSLSGNKMLALGGIAALFGGGAAALTLLPYPPSRTPLSALIGQVKGTNRQSSFQPIEPIRPKGGLGQNKTGMRVKSGAQNVRSRSGNLFSGAGNAVRSTGNTVVRGVRNIKRVAVVDVAVANASDPRRALRNVSRITFGGAGVAGALSLPFPLAIPVAFYSGTKIGDGVVGLARGTEQRGFREMMDHVPGGDAIYYGVRGISLASPWALYKGIVEWRLNRILADPTASGAAKGILGPPKPSR